jgi:hypothetical protein
VIHYQEIYPKLFAWHRYLATVRDPEESGLVTIYHPWESGTDNSPRWNDALERLEVGELPPHPRPDLQFADPSQRPTEEKYDRYIWLVELIKRVRCEESEIYASHPFLVKDVLFSAILVRANEALLEIAEVVGTPDEERSAARGWISRSLRGLEERWDPKLGLCLDYDLRAAAGAHRGRLRAAHSGHQEPRSPRSHPQDPRLARVSREPGVALAAAAQRQPARP